MKPALELIFVRRTVVKSGPFDIGHRQNQTVFRVELGRIEHERARSDEQDALDAVFLDIDLAQRNAPFEVWPQFERIELELKFILFAKNKGGQKAQSSVGGEKKLHSSLLKPPPRKPPLERGGVGHLVVFFSAPPHRTYEHLTNLGPKSSK